MGRPAKQQREVRWREKSQMWYACVTFDGGVERKVRVPGKENQEKAQKQLDALLKERMLNGKPAEIPTTLTVWDIIEAWAKAGYPNGGLPNNRDVQQRHETVKGDNSLDVAESLLRNHVKDFGAPRAGNLGNRNANRLKTKDLKEHFVEVDKRRRLTAREDTSYEDARLASGTVYRIWWLLANAFAWAKKEGLMAHNPALDAKLPPVRPGVPRRAFQRDELPAIFAAILNDPRKAMWLTFVMIGTRPGEVMGLRWKWLEIDEEPYGIWIEERAGFRRGKYTGQKPPKAGSKRAVELHPMLAKALYDWREYLIAFGQFDPEGFVFPSANGTALGYTSIRRWLDKLMGTIDLGTWMPYELRHSFVSLTYDESQDLQVVADLAGHNGKDLKTTMGYRHRVRTLDPRGVEAWNGLIEGMRKAGLDPAPDADLVGTPDPEETPKPELRLVTNEKPPTIPFKTAWQLIPGINSEHQATLMRKGGKFPVKVHAVQKGALHVSRNELEDWLRNNPDGIPRPARDKATHCKRNHELIDGNLYYNSTTGQTSCRTCRVINKREARLRAAQ